MLKYNLEFLFVGLILGSLFLTRPDDGGLPAEVVRKTVRESPNYDKKEVLLAEAAVSSLPRLDSWKKEADVEAFSFIGADLASGEIVLGQSENKRWPIASLTKLMTALVVVEEFDLTVSVQISEKALATEGLSGNLKAGEEYRTLDLLKLMLLVSSNDSAQALAEFYGEKKFVERMNAKARELGMNETNFSDSTGLSSLNQSTANDVKKLVARLASGYPKIFSLTAGKETVVKGKTFKNLHKFAGRKNFLGGKTGYLDEAKRNLVSLFLMPDGEKMIFVVLGSSDNFGDTERLLAKVNGHP